MQTRDANILAFLSEPTARYFMPPFQRGYEWDYKHYADLFRGIMAAADDKRFHYWMGTVLIKKNESQKLQEWKDGIRVYNVADGQQRMISISLMLQATKTALRKIGFSEVLPETAANPPGRRAALLFQKIAQATLVEHDKLRPKIVVAKKNREDYNAILLETLDIEAEATTCSRIHLAAQFFLLEILGRQEENRNAEQVLLRAERLLSVLQTQAKISLAEMGEEDSPEQIFVRANSKGKQLTAAEHINGFLQTNISDFETEQAKAHAEHWEPIERAIHQKQTPAILSRLEEKLTEGKPSDPMSEMLELITDAILTPTPKENPINEDFSEAPTLRKIEREVRLANTKPEELADRETQEDTARQNAHLSRDRSLQTLRNIQTTGIGLLEALHPWHEENPQQELFPTEADTPRDPLPAPIQQAAEDLSTLPGTEHLRLTAFWLFQFHQGRLTETGCSEKLGLLENVLSRRCICNKSELGGKFFQTLIRAEQLNPNSELLQTKLGEKNPSNSEVQHSLQASGRSHQKAARIHILLRIENQLRRKKGEKPIGPQGYQTTDFLPKSILHTLTPTLAARIRKSLANSCLYKNRKPIPKEPISSKITKGFLSTKPLLKISEWTEESFGKWENHFLNLTKETWPEITATNDGEEGSWETHYCTAILIQNKTVQQADKIPWKRASLELLGFVWKHKREFFQTCMDIIGETPSWLRTTPAKNYEQIVKDSPYHWFKNIPGKRLQNLQELFLQAAAIHPEEFRVEMTPKDTDKTEEPQNELPLND